MPAWLPLPLHSDPPSLLAPPHFPPSPRHPSMISNYLIAAGSSEGRRGSRRMGKDPDEMAAVLAATSTPNPTPEQASSLRMASRLAARTAAAVGAGSSAIGPGEAQSGGGRRRARTSTLSSKTPRRRADNQKGKKRKKLSVSVDRFQKLMRSITKTSKRKPL
jgi:hypothetical protein